MYMCVYMYMYMLIHIYMIAKILLQYYVFFALYV